MNRYLVMVLAIVTLLVSTHSRGQADLPPLVAARCAGCHPAPRATSMPRHAWPKIIDSMEEVMAAQGQPLLSLEKRFISEYYIQNSNPALSNIPDEFADSGIPFQSIAVGLPSRDVRPQVTSTKVADLDGDGQRDDLILTDNTRSSVSWLRVEGGEWFETEIANAPAPVNTTPFDFDNDGDIDLAVSAMGFMHPNDELIGEFHLLINRGDGEFEPKKLLSGVPRITDAAPADFDNDGDIDFVLAMFGWRDTGQIGLLRQLDSGEFELEEIYVINGAMRVLTNDVNEDGRPDFVALITQQHEAIMQFTNEGNGKFSDSLISRANHPAFGSSGIQLADLDRDGDEDILYTNGDMMDENPEPKPYHGAQWFENLGGAKYAVHHLVAMPGCYGSQIVDFDRDGDLDLVLSALYFQWKDHDFPSLIWLENLGGFRDFTRRRIAYAPTNLANIAVADFNNDGLLDIAGGGMHVPGPLDRKGRVTLWIQGREVAEKDQ